jgi:pimeloyl-ACP methyl ester carboxylesterase
MDKPTIVFVTGALTAPSCYDRIVPLLGRVGYPTVQPALPSANPADPNAHTAESDGQYLLEQHVRPLVEAGKDVVVFAHSFGATAMSGANSGITKKDRKAKGEEGGVVGIIYISGALVPSGQSQVEYLGGELPPFCKVDHVSAVVHTRQSAN